MKGERRKVDWIGERGENLGKKEDGYASTEPQRTTARKARHQKRAPHTHVSSSRTTEDEQQPAIDNSCNRKTNTNDSNTHAIPPRQEVSAQIISAHRLNADNIFANALICPFCTTFFGDCESNDPSALPPSYACSTPSRSVVLVAASCLYIDTGSRAR